MSVYTQRHTLDNGVGDSLVTVLGTSTKCPMTLCGLLLRSLKAHLRGTKHNIIRSLRQGYRGFLIFVAKTARKPRACVLANIPITVNHQCHAISGCPKRRSAYQRTISRREFGELQHAAEMATGALVHIATEFNAFRDIGPRHA